MSSAMGDLYAMEAFLDDDEEEQRMLPSGDYIGRSLDNGWTAFTRVTACGSNPDDSPFLLCGVEVDGKACRYPVRGTEDLVHDHTGTEAPCPVDPEGKAFQAIMMALRQFGLYRQCPVVGCGFWLRKGASTSFASLDEGFAHSLRVGEPDYENTEHLAHHCRLLRHEPGRPSQEQQAQGAMGIRSLFERTIAADACRWVFRPRQPSALEWAFLAERLDDTVLREWLNSGSLVNVVQQNAA